MLNCHCHQPPPPLPTPTYLHPHQPSGQPVHDMVLHRTMSDSFVWGAGQSQTQTHEQSAHQSSQPTDHCPPLPSCAPWTRPAARQSQQQTGSRSDCKTLYYHLAAIFPAGVVERAMDLMPHETNPQVLCKYILSNMNTVQPAMSK